MTSNKKLLLIAVLTFCSLDSFGITEKENSLKKTAFNQFQMYTIRFKKTIS